MRSNTSTAMSIKPIFIKQASTSKLFQTKKQKIFVENLLISELRNKDYFFEEGVSKFEKIGNVFEY